MHALFLTQDQASLKAAFDSLSDMSHSSHSSSHNHPIEHLGHCFDYLRQAVMCAADTTLEPTEDLKSLGVKVVDGWNVTHQCRNYEAVYEFAERHRYLNSSGTL
jgi:hypothetical protein